MKLPPAQSAQYYKSQGIKSAIRAAHRELPDMAALGALPPAFVQVVSNVRTALETASPAN